MAQPGKVQKRVRFIDGMSEAYVVPPGTWSTVQSMPLVGVHSKNLAPLQLRRARQMKIYAARQRDTAELQLLRQKVRDLMKRPQYVTFEVEKIVEVPTVVHVVDQMEEHPKVWKSKLSLEEQLQAGVFGVPTHVHPERSLHAQSVAGLRRVLANVGRADVLPHPACAAASECRIVASVIIPGRNENEMNEDDDDEEDEGDLNSEEHSQSSGRRTEAVRTPRTWETSETLNLFGVTA